PRTARAPQDDGERPRHQCQTFPSARNLKRWILPVAVFGRSLRNSIQCGYLYGASRSRQCCCSAWAVLSLAAAEGLRTTNAFGLIRRSSLGHATTAASSTS